MNYYQGLSYHGQQMNPNQLNQTHKVIYAEPIIHEPMNYSDRINNYYGYTNAKPSSTFSQENYSPYPLPNNYMERTTLNPNMFQPVLPDIQAMDLLPFKKLTTQVQPKKQPNYSNQSNETTQPNDANQSAEINQSYNTNQGNVLNQTNYSNQASVQSNYTNQANMLNQANYTNHMQQQQAMYQTNPYPSHVMNAPTDQTTAKSTHPVDPYFVNPLQHQANVNHPMYNPYPKMKILPKQQSTSTSLLSSFKDPDGKYNLVSVVNTCGQMVNVVNQVGSIFKGIGGIFKV